MSRVSVSGPAALNFQSRGHEETLEETLAAAGLVSNDLIPVFLHYSSYKRGESIHTFSNVLLIDSFHEYKVHGQCRVSG